MAAKVVIRPLGARPAAAILDRLDDIFFSSSTVRTFAGPADRAAFRERWLGRYLLCDIESCFVALQGGTEVIGYVVGALEDPARTARFADLASSRAFAVASAACPAHLHVNVEERQRSAGVGAWLVERFADHAAAGGAAGVHVVTAAASRNVRFYNRCGFVERARLASGGGTVFLGRDFRVAPPTAI